MGKTFQDFLDYRNKTLAKKLPEGGQGYHVFNNALAKEIYEAKPTTLLALSKIKGFPMGGNRMEKYGKDIINWFMTSSVFSK